MKILGLSSSLHDSSASLSIDGVIVAASAEERFNREKHTGAFPRQAIQFCLDKAKLDISEIDIVAVGMNWAERAQSRWEVRNVDLPDELEDRAKELYQTDTNRHEEVSKVMNEEFGYQGEIKFLDHHDCHASSVYFTSPFNESAILVIDGAGEIACTRVYNAKETKIEKLLQIDYPNSIGRFYAWITDYLGFKIDSDEGKIMGLAPYGDSSYVEAMRKVLAISKDGLYNLNFDYFEFDEDGLSGFSENFKKIFGPSRKEKKDITQKHKNIAFAAQEVLEEAVLAMVKKTKELTGLSNLCLSGGVFLNSVANGKIEMSKTFDNIFIYPASGDDGVSVGAALYPYFSSKDVKLDVESNRNPFKGYCSNDDEIQFFLKKFNLDFTASDNIYEEVAELLVEDKIIGWYSGSAEFGPRALGNRSILANPMNRLNVDRVNSKIKFRESFRPFAPSVLDGHQNDFFNMEQGFCSPYMLRAFTVKQNKLDKIPAVVHVNDTARVHVVSEEFNYRFYKLLEAFYEKTNIPVLLNTSFNRAGDTLVNNPKHAIETYFGSDLDILILGNFIVKNKPQK